MDEVLLDQIPALSELQRTLEQLAITNAPITTQSSPFAIQLMPEFRNEILSNKNWKEIAEMQMKTIFAMEKADIQKELEEFSEIYEHHMIDEFLEKPKCGNCGKEAT